MPHFIELRLRFRLRDIEITLTAAADGVAALRFRASPAPPAAMSAFRRCRQLLPAPPLSFLR